MKEINKIFSYIFYMWYLSDTCWIKNILDMSYGENASTLL